MVFRTGSSWEGSLFADQLDGAAFHASGRWDAHQLQDGRGYVQDATAGVLPISAALLITLFAGWWHAMQYYVWNPPNIHHGGH